MIAWLDYTNTLKSRKGPTMKPSSDAGRPSEKPPVEPGKPDKPSDPKPLDSPGPPPNPPPPPPPPTKPGF